MLKEINGEIEFYEASSVTEHLRSNIILKTPLIFLGINVDNAHQNIIKDLGALRTQYQDAPILLLVEGVNEKIITHYLKAGASGFQFKHNDPSRIISYVKLAVEGNLPLDIKNLMSKDEMLAFQDTGFLLTAREYEIAKLLSQFKKQAEIARQLGLSQQTVSQAKVKIFKKLNIDNAIKLSQVMSYILVKP
ncbi:LuxR C-terminal-related transcriptional regulator [Dyadobacter subterraneus]|uniref:Response regulator transcription factor n=1 Tax=Dyadobacter subterraneus TaxID=2773304 RepID=A0ABR9WMD6_9BACT|nr:LuxR C-terminal-related transcriptional regulator [Dyadobacter subterraneus]MBE9466657.1 response regulator transcription factor [Dyadobacter subterraneus]